MRLAGPTGFFAAMLGFLGVNVEQQLQHYPYVRQWDGPSIRIHATGLITPTNRSAPCS